MGGRVCVCMWGGPRLFTHAVTQFSTCTGADGCFTETRKSIRFFKNPLKFTFLNVAVSVQVINVTRGGSLYKACCLIWVHFEIEGARSWLSY